MLPPYLRVAPKFLPKSDGIARNGGMEDFYNPDGDDYDATVWQVEFGVEELLPNYALPPNA